MIDRRTSLTILFLLVSLLCPIAVFPISDVTTIVGYAFFAPFCGYDFGNITNGITIIIGMEYWTVYMPLVTPLSFLFLLQVIRSMKGKTPQNRAFYSGILSLVFPGVFLTWMYLPTFFMTGLYGYAGPIPIQFILGMSLVSRYGYHFEELDWFHEED